MAIPDSGDNGALEPAVQVTISFSVPVETVLDPGPLICSPEEQRLPEVRALMEQFRRRSLPESDGELLQAVRDLLERREAVQEGPLSRVACGPARWDVARPGAGN